MLAMLLPLPQTREIEVYTLSSMSLKDKDVITSGDIYNFVVEAREKVNLIP